MWPEVTHPSTFSGPKHPSRSANVPVAHGWFNLHKTVVIWGVAGSSERAQPASQQHAVFAGRDSGVHSPIFAPCRRKSGGSRHQKRSPIRPSSLQKTGSLSSKGSSCEFPAKSVRATFAHAAAASSSFSPALACAKMPCRSCKILPRAF